MRICYLCKKEKELSEFSKHRGFRDGISRECLPCGAKRSREWKKLNPLKKIYSKRAYTANSRADSMGISGRITIKNIQMVYEDNIKRFGTLTCYICKTKIDFGKDSIDHLVPFSRGGNNDSNNMGVSHLICNLKKGRLTSTECFDNYRVNKDYWISNVCKFGHKKEANNLYISNKGLRICKICHAKNVRDYRAKKRLRNNQVLL